MSPRRHDDAFANSGSLTLWLDDVQKQSLTFIDNDTRTLTDVRLGAQGVDAGTNGTLYFDDFESRRFSYIGMLPDPGVDDPSATNPAGWFTRTYAYSPTIPHAVTNVTPETGSPDTYEYDANGNMTCRVENGVVYTHTYNAENRASSIAKRNTNCTGTIIESWSFVYDGDGVRVGTVHFTGTQGTPDSTTSYYMGGQFEVKDGATKKYYSIAGMMVAMKDSTGVQYLLTDHLGSTVAVTNSSGTLTSQQRYLPFGGVRSIPNSPILATDFGYTGQRMLDEDMGGIMDYKARFYSPALGRFQQPDTVIPNPANPQSLNRFGYVGNNPIVFNDPTGHIKCEFDAQGNDYCYENDRKTKIRKEPKEPPVDFPPVTIPESECGRINCDHPSSPEDIMRELAPFTTSEACNYFLDEVTCNPETWQFLSDPYYWQSVQLSLDNSCLSNFWECYNPDAFIGGVGISGSGPGFYNVAGIEEIVMFSDLSHKTYGYAGHGTSAGIGGSGSAYGGIVFNLQNTSAYKGPFGSAGITVSIADRGITAFYFWDSTKQPLDPGVTQGLAVGYAPGAQVSIWGSSTVYTGIP